MSERVQAWPELKTYKVVNLNESSTEKVLFICADLETDGLDVKTANVLEIGAYVHSAAQSSQKGFNNMSFSGLVRPESGCVNEDAFAINKISESDLSLEPNFTIRIRQFFQFLKDMKRASDASKVVLIFHNGFKFDIPILSRMFTETKVDVPGWLFGSDSLPMLDAIFPGKFGAGRGNKTLQSLTLLYDIKQPTHRALQDSQSLSAILTHLHSECDIYKWLYSYRKPFLFS